ncbi:MAG: PRC-barrel domain-containing protein, partial [Actinomycetota bacterium]|nr:PRC-barrel domain-containing protein [Actinomycetota bacterium]
MDLGNVQQMVGSTAYGSDGDKIGKVGQVYLDDASGEPDWATVNTGLFGTSETFVPLQGASFDNDRLNVAHSQEKVKDAPKVDLDGDHLPESEERRLYEHYGIGFGGY